MVIRPKLRGFICITTHPEGCAAHVRHEVAVAEKGGRPAQPVRHALVLGSSAGYGLATRIAAAIGSGAATHGVYFDRAPEPDRLGTPGWYNNAAFESIARARGLHATSQLADAFSDDTKRATLDALRAGAGPVDLVVYSLASPRRTHPVTGAIHKSVLKPIGATFHGRTVDIDKETVSDVTVEPATPEEISDTVAVMGGDDWERWIIALDEAGLLAPGARTVAYSYIGPELTHAIYKNGTIGRAKEDLEATATRLTARLAGRGGAAYVSVNKALATLASSAIPVVPLYLAALTRVMKEHGTHEGCIEQMVRLLRDRLGSGGPVPVDEAGRIRLDELEMVPSVQAATSALCAAATTENLRTTTDFAGYKEDYLRLFGFAWPGIDYEADVEV